MLRPVLALMALLFALTAGAAYPQSGAVGRGVIRDDKNYNDRITLTMIGVPAAPRDTVYEAWLVTDNGAEQSSLGNLKVESDGTVRHAITRDENFLARYNKLRISLEPRGKEDPKQAGKTVLEGDIPLPVMAEVRDLLVFFSEAPGGSALAIGLRNQSSMALKQVNIASNAVASGDLGKAKESAEAIINILEGQKGPHYGDLNKDQSVQNPGDGYGLLTYAEQAANHAGLAGEAEGASTAVKASARQVQSSVGNVTAWATAMRDDALKMLEASDVDSVKPLIESMMKNGMASLNGIDENGNGLVEPIEGEGGAITAYVNAQNMGTYDVRTTGSENGGMEPAGSPQSNEAGSPQDEQEAAPLEQNMVPVFFFGILAGTVIVVAMAFLWVRSKIEITRQ